MDISKRINNIEDRIKTIEDRNKRVEADKAWETSRARAIFIAVSTYLLIFVFMKLINDDHSFLNAFIASLGYLISNSTYGFLKKLWLARKNKEK
jgi:hypothetical protein